MSENTRDIKEANLVICDDDPMIRELLLSALDPSGYDIRLFESGEQAIDACNSQLPDLVLSDIKMPGLSGYEVCRWVKENTNEAFIPVVLLTSLNEVEDTVSGFSCGADEYITKPFAFAELKARIDAMLRIKFLTDELKQTQDLLAEKERQIVAMSVAGGAAHELGQPLTTISLNCRLLQSLDAKSEDFASTLQEIESQCGRMKQILDKLGQLTSFKIRNYVGDINIIDLED